MQENMQFGDGTSTVSAEFRSIEIVHHVHLQVKILAIAL